MPAPMSRAFSQGGDGADLDVAERAGRCSAGSARGRRRGRRPARRLRALDRRPAAAPARPVERRDLARDAVDREQVGPVAASSRARARPRRAAARPRAASPARARPSSTRMPRVVAGRARARCSERIIPRETSPRSFASSSCVTAGEHRARKRDGDRRALAEVPRAADDLARLALPHVDAAELEPVRVRMLPGLDDAADAVEVGVAVLVGDAAAQDALRPRASRSSGARRARRVGTSNVDVVAQPVERDAHQNCSRSRRSFCQSIADVGEPVAEHERCARGPSRTRSRRPPPGRSRRTRRRSGRPSRRRRSRSSPRTCTRGSPAPSQRKHDTSASTEGSVKGKKLVRNRTSRSSPKSARSR